MVSLRTGTALPHAMTRLDIPTGKSFEDFLAAFEAAVPSFDLPRMKEIAESGGSWSDVEQAVTENAPNGFVLFASIDGRVLMSIAGTTGPRSSTSWATT